MDNKLKEKYGLFTAIAMVVGIVIGSGVFFKAEKVLTATGGNLPLGILAWVLGGAIMAAVGIGLYNNVSEAADAVVKTKGEYKPMGTDYTEAYERYCALDKLMN